MNEIFKKGMIIVFDNENDCVQFVLKLNKLGIENDYKFNIGTEEVLSVEIL